jgi:hypothetical protein
MKYLLLPGCLTPLSLISHLSILRSLFSIIPILKAGCEPHIFLTIFKKGLPIQKTVK